MPFLFKVLAYLSLLFMRTVAEWLLLREAASAEFRVLNSACDIAISINEIDSACNANRPTLGIDESFHILRHVYGLVEVIAKRLRT